MSQQPASSSRSVVMATDASRIPATEHFGEYVKNGGSNVIKVNGSVTPVTFSVTPPAGYDLEVSRIIMYIEAATAMASDEFGDQAALSNGVQIIANSEVLTTWQDNVDMLEDMYDLSSAGAAFGKTTQTLAGRWTFTKDTNGRALLIPYGSTFAVVVNDDLSGLNIFRIKVKGRLIAT